MATGKEIPLPVEISIIIVTYNPGFTLISCLESLRPHLDDSREIIIVDNASSDGVIDLIRRDFPEVKIIANTDNRGFAAANNQGLAAASGNYLLLLNPDTLIRDDAPGELQRFLAVHPHVGIVGPRTSDAQNRVSLSASGPYTPISILWQYLGLASLFSNIAYGKFRSQVQQASEPFEVTWVQGSCMMICRKLYEQIGGLDEDLFLFSEEPDYCQRAFAHGWHTYYVPVAQIEHHESTTVSRYPLIKMRHYHISPLHYFHKRGENSSVRFLKFGFTIELLMKLLVRLLQMKWTTDKSSRTRIQSYWVVIKEIWQYQGKAR
jgi:GT2 family glycosyltransferase